MRWSDYITTIYIYCIPLKVYGILKELFLQILMTPYIIIDFDSTINKLEALDELARIVDVRNNSSETSQKIKAITELGMQGQITFPESLKMRMELLKFNRDELMQLVEVLRQNFTESFIKNIKYFEEISNQVIIISGGFKDFIIPALDQFKLNAHNIYANEFVFDQNRTCAGIVEENLLAQELGKVKVVNNLNLFGEIIIVGDGFTDYQIKEQGAAHKFIAFTENVCRKSVCDKADFIANSFDDVIEFLSHYQ